MSESNFQSFGGKDSLLKKFSSSSTQKEKKQARKILLLIFGLTVFSVVLAIAYRELPSFFKGLFKPKTVISKKFLQKEPTVTPTPPFEKEKQSLLELIKPFRGTYGVFFQDLESGKSFSINGETKMQAASLNKLPVMLALYREAEAGRVDLDAVYRLQADDKRNGAGSLQGRPVGYEITYRQMLELMGKQSDNTAFNIVSRTLGSEKIQALEDQLGMSRSSFADWEMTPQDVGTFFRKLFQEKIINEKDKQEMLSFLTDTIWEDRIPAGIPKGVRVAHKIGTETGVISDAGIIFSPKPFILVIMTQEANEIEAKKALPEISAKVWEFFGSQ